MTNNPNDHDPKPLHPTDPAELPPIPDEETDEVKIEDLPDLGPVDLAELSGELPTDDPVQEGGVWSERHPEPLLPEVPNSVVNLGAFDLPVPPVDAASFAEEGLVDFPEATGQSDSDSSHLFQTPKNPLPRAVSEATSHEAPLDLPVPPVDAAAFEEGLINFPEPTGQSDGDSAHLFQTPTTPPPRDLAGASGNLAPIAPASGWYDPQNAMDPKLKAEREITDSNLFGGPSAKVGELIPFIEGSDILAGGNVPQADLAATSDVLLGASLDNAAEPPPVAPGEVPAVGSPSELPLGVMPLPGVESDEIREARAKEAWILEAQSLEDEDAEKPFDDSDSLFDGLNAEIPDHFTAEEGPAFEDELEPTPPKKPDSDARKRDLPKNSGDDELKGLGLTPDFGESPKFTPDASSILADLSVMGSNRFDNASEVRLDSPGLSRTIGGEGNDGSEFGLELPGEELSKGHGSASIVWSNPEAIGAEEDDHNAATRPEMALEDDDLPLDVEPSPKSVNRTPPPSDEGDSVEFSDFPSAEDESTASQVFRSSLKQPTPPPIKPKSTPSTGDLDTLDWNIDESDLEPAPQPVTPARMDKGSKPVVGGLSGRRAQDPHDAPTKESKSAMPPVAEKKPKPGSKSGEGAGASVDIDWMSGSAPQTPVSSASGTTGPVVVGNWGSDSLTTRHADLVPVPVQDDLPEEFAEEPRAEVDDHEPPLHDRRTKPDMSMRSDREPRRSGKGGWLGGTFVGMVIAGGACAGAYFGGVIPNGDKAAPTTLVNKQVDPTAPTTPEGKQPTAADVSAAVRAGDLATAKKLAASVKETSGHIKAAQGEAELFSLLQEQKEGVSLAKNPALLSANKKLQSFLDDPVAKTPEGEKAAVKATIQLGIVYQLAGEDENARKLYIRARDKYTKYASTFDAALDRMDATAPAAPMPDGSSRRLTPAEAQQLLAVLVLLQDEPVVVKEDDVEAGVYFWKAVKLAKAESYTEAIELIKKAKAAHIKQAKAMAGRGLNPLSDPLEQIFPRSCDNLKLYWELQNAVSSNKSVAEAFQKDGAEKALAELEKRAAGAVKLMTDLKESTEKLTVAAKDLKDAKELVAKLEKDFKDADEAKVAAEKKFADEEKARKGLDEVVNGIVKELQAAKLLPEKFDNAELLAAQKRAMEKGTGPTLGTLLSPETMAVGGAGLSAAQLLDLSERTAKSERATKVATDKLAAEAKRLTSEHAEAMKKLADAHATEVAKLKDDQTVELKKAADTYAADAKKLNDGFDAKIKELNAAIAAEKKRTEEVAAKFKADLGNAVTPAQAIDLWLPLLVELRRPSDSEGALAAAMKAIATSQPDSEDVGKARTVAGLALLFQNKYPEAKGQFDAAKSNPNYEAALAAKKQWATAADVGSQSVTDPLAAYRRAPVLPSRDTVVAARFLDAGIKAYKASRFKDAVEALTESTKADATDAVAWYFLGAAKIATGTADEGKDDIRQGAVREAASNVSTQVISRALSPIQGKARDAITAARP